MGSGIAGSEAGRGAAAGSRPGLLAAILVPLAAGLLLASWKWRGTEGLAGSAVGLGIGGSIALAGGLLRRKAWTETGHRMVQALMLSVAVSFGLFVAATIAVGLLWREAAAPVILTALGIYVAATIVSAAGKA